MQVSSFPSFLFSFLLSILLNGCLHHVYHMVALYTVGFVVFHL